MVQAGMLSAIIWSIKRKFPAVKNISTDVLQKKLDQSASAQNVQLFLIDSRKREEFDVSHLQHATFLDFKSDNSAIKEFLDSHLKETDNEKIEIVCYCSVGYRSSVLAEKISGILTKESKTDKIDVFNLEGSIFKWANENKSLIQENGDAIEYVHPFSFLWRVLGLNLSKWKWPADDLQ